MGTGCSKEGSGSRGTRGDLFRCCFGGFSCDSDGLDNGGKGKRTSRKLWTPCMNHKKRQSDKVGCESCIKDECTGAIHVPTISSRIEFDEWVQDNASSVESIRASSSMPTANRQLSECSSSHFHPPLDLFRDHIGIRSNRNTSIGSSEASTLFSTSLIILEPAAATPEHIDLEGLQCGIDIPQDGKDQVTVPSEDIGNHAAAVPSEPCGRGSSLGNHLGAGNSESRRPCRHSGTSEPQGGSIQFSRQLSVGRLRDRVLRRHGTSVGPFNQISDYDASRDRHGNVTQIWAPMGEEMAYQNAEPRQSFSNFNGHQNQQSGVGTANNNHLAHRTTFIERRQRVRSQVHALQWLGSRFENLVGHNRSCILAGHYRSGRCLCRTNIIRENAAGETSTRASISRIVMLAEALFEVLDEIHQQSVVLSSRPTVSAFGSLPAPKEVVEQLPVKIYAQSGVKNEEVAQCQICLVEYAEGDWLRILPCHHEFHQSCVDKWLKEIHRVCPLCRGNVFLSDSLPES